MKTFEKDIEQLRENIINSILSLMKANQLTEITLESDDHDPVFVIWFDDLGDPVECTVHKIKDVGNDIVLEVHNKITEDAYDVTSEYELALANPIWLNEMYEFMLRILSQTEGTGTEVNAICCRCGSTDVTCEAMINPNTKAFDHYTDESFLYGWCDSCKTGTVISDTAEVKDEILQQYSKFTAIHNKEPQLALCRIIWKDNMKDTEVTIALEHIPEELDNNIFFYCNSLSDFMAMAEYGCEDFIVIECIEFTDIQTSEKECQNPMENIRPKPSANQCNMDLHEYYQKSRHEINSSIMEMAGELATACLVNKYNRPFEEFVEPDEEGNPESGTHYKDEYQDDYNRFYDKSYARNDGLMKFDVTEENGITRQ